MPGCQDHIGRHRVNSDGTNRLLNIYIMAFLLLDAELEIMILHLKDQLQLSLRPSSSFHFHFSSRSIILLLCG